jgi:hypothetical protein
MDTNQETGVSLNDIADLLEQPEEEQQPVDEELAAQPEEEEGADEQPEATDADDDLIEAEYEGKTYRVPKELKDALLRQGDYTRKTQEVAELRKAAEERARFVQSQEQLMSVTFDKAAELKQIQTQLAQFEQLDWQALSDSDPVQAQKLLIARQNLDRSLQQKAQELQQAQAQYQHLTVQHRQQMLQEQSKELKQRLPDFDSKMAERIRSAVKQYGYGDEELSNVTDARLVHVLHDAMRWRELQEKRPEAMKKVAQAPVVVKPQAKAPKPRNQAVVQRLKSHGRVEDLAALL